MSLRIATVATSIKGISVSGLTIKDVDEIPVSVGDRVSMLIPKPDYMTNFSMVRDSYGAGVAKMTASYTLNYRLCYAREGTGRNLDVYDNMIDLVALILDAVMALAVVSGCEDITPEEITNMGIVNDPSENEYYGCDISFRVTEFVN